MIDRYFRAHPRSVGETYVEHFHAASSFATTMMLAGLAGLVHALVPHLFQGTGSRTIKRLHDRMVLNRARGRGPAEAAPSSSEAL